MTKTMRTLILLAATSIPAACAYHTGIEAGTPTRLTTSQMASVDTGLRASLKDPDSARIAGVSAARGKDGTLTVCGHVNARNSFGGYTGFVPFSGFIIEGSRIFQVTSIGNPADDNYGIRVVCRDSGAPV